MLTDAIDAAAAEVAAVEEGAALAAFHLIDSDQDRYITQGDLLRTFGMHLDKRAMQRMLEKIDWRTNRMNFEQFQLLLAENRMSDKERGVLEYTSALEHISKKGEFAYKKAGAEEKAAAEKAAAEKAAADSAAAEKAAAEKAAAENAETEKAPFTPPQSSSMSSSWATEKAAAEKADADKAAAEKAFAIGKEIGKTLSSVFVESPVALFKSITSGKYVEDEKADPDEAAFVAILEAAEEGKATAEKAAAEKVATAKPVELDLRGARKRLANCEELIARIKAMEPPAPVLEELSHLELVLVSWSPEVRERLSGAEPKKVAADKAAAEKAPDIGKEIGKTLSSVFVESPVALFKSITSGKYVEDEKADPDEAAFVAISKAAVEGKATAEKVVAEKAAAEKATAKKVEPPKEPTSSAERVARMVTEATEAAKAETARLVAEAEAAKAETARLVADAAQAVQQWGIGGLGRNLVGQIGELGKPPPQWAWRWEPGELTVNGNLKDVIDPLVSFLRQNGFPIKQDDLFTKWDRHLKTVLKSFLNANGAVRDPLDRLGRREPLRTGNGFGTEWNVEAVTALQTFLKNNGADDLEITQRMGLNGDVLFGVCDNDPTIMALQGFLNRQMVQMALD
jgi:hypothetical protein